MREVFENAMMEGCTCVHVSHINRADAGGIVCYKFFGRTC